MENNNKKLNREELIELARKIINLEFPEGEESEMTYLFCNSVPHPEAYSFLFHHKPESTPEEIVDKALSYQPIVMPPPQSQD